MTMKAIILAGGKGTRLHPLTFTVPKPLLPVGDKPIIEIIIENLKSYGIDEIIICLGYKWEFIKAFLQDGSKYSVKITYVLEEDSLGTAGPLSLIYREVEFADDDLFILMNGDILTKINFSKLADFHKKNKFELTVCVKEYENTLPYGVLNIKDNKVLSVAEKPSTKHFISTGIYALNASIFKEIPYGSYFTVPDLVNKMNSENRSVGAFIFDEEWFAVEDLQNIAEINNNFRLWTGQNEHE